MIKNTNDVLKRNERKFNRSRRMVKLTLALILLLMAGLQYHHLIEILQSI
ncbi:hypothetical protein [Chitinophaga sp. Cy-1792]|nr:hypothetical protein [Chitinophaga sp. Cy-1792]